MSVKLIGTVYQKDAVSRMGLRIEDGLVWYVGALDPTLPGAAVRSRPQLNVGHMPFAEFVDWTEGAQSIEFLKFEAGVGMVWPGVIVGGSKHTVRGLPLCGSCGQVFRFALDEPFANCGCPASTTEWGHGDDGDAYRKIERRVRKYELAIAEAKKEEDQNG